MVASTRHMQHSSQTDQQLQLRISTFENSRGTSATQQTLTFAELCKDFQEPIIVDEQLQYNDPRVDVLKESLPAWSPAQFAGDQRANANVLSAACLTFDLDTGSDGEKQGLTPADFNLLRKYLLSLNCAYCVHSTFTAGFFAPRAKLRVILPLAKPVSVDEYLRLWDKHAAELPVRPDKTRRHPGGLFFAPAVFASHHDMYVHEARADAPPLGKRTFGLNNVKLGAQKWLDSVRTASEKHNALNTAALAMTRELLEQGREVEDVKAAIWPQLQQALRENTTSAPVRSWSSAEACVDRAVRDAKKHFDARENLTDPLPKKLTVELSAVRRRRAELDLKKLCSTVEKNPEKLSEAARVVGRYLPAGWLDEDAAIKALKHAVALSESTQALSEVESIIALGLAAGKAAPLSAVTSWMENLQCDDKGCIKGNDENCAKILANHPDCENLLFTNSRTGVHFIRHEPPWEMPEHRRNYPVMLHDADGQSIAVWLVEQTGSAFGVRRALETAMAVAQQNSEDPFKDWLLALKWDGIPRLSRWLIDYAGAEDSEYTRAVGEAWLTALVARTLRDDAKVDNMLVLVGPQGVGKSSLLAAVVPYRDLFTDYLPERDQDRIIALGVHSIIEVAELSAFGRKDNEYVKALLSGQAEYVRRPYGRAIEKIVKRAVFSGSTNAEHGFLSDATGGRRYWVVKTGQCLPAAFAAVREQILAEAVARFNTEKKWHLTDELERAAVAVQEEYRENDVAADELETYLTTGVPADMRRHWKLQKEGSLNMSDNVRMWTFKDQFDEGSNVPKYITMTQVCSLLRLDSNKYSTRVCNLLVRLGWKKVGRIEIEGQKVTKWEK